MENSIKTSYRNGYFIHIRINHMCDRSEIWVGKCGFSQRNITISALSLSIGLGFTQLPGLFVIFPSIVRSVFAENCVAVVFLTAIILNLVLPKNYGEK